MGDFDEIQESADSLKVTRHLSLEEDNPSSKRPHNLTRAPHELAIIENEKRSIVSLESLKSKLSVVATEEEREAIHEAIIIAQQELPPLTKRQILCIIMLATMNFFGVAVFGCMAPFFPRVAAEKGASLTLIGFIFGIFDLVAFFLSPVFGKYVSVIGPKKCYYSGILILGISSICFGFFYLLPNGVPFIVMCFIVRIAQAIGETSQGTATFVIIAQEFPGRNSFIYGFSEIFSGLGFAAGSPMGGALYDFDGFKLPFIVFGSAVTICGLFAMVLIPKQDQDSQTESESTEKRSFFDGFIRLLKIPVMTLMCVLVMISACSLTFLDPTLEPHLKDFHLSTAQIGFIFLALGGTYTVAAPLYGYIVDKTGKKYPMIAAGSFLLVLALLFIGPCPALGFDKQVWLVVVSLVLLGLGAAAIVIPMLQQVAEIALNNNFPDNSETYGLISGLMGCSFSLGGFLGPTMFGGVIYGQIGLSWTATVTAALCFTLGVVLLVYLIRKPFRNAENLQEKNVDIVIGNDS